MALNLNTNPYYDDFDAANNYNKILFKPGVAVQARELTQLQTILQDQITNLSSFTLKEGAIMSGCEESINVVPYIKVDDEDASATEIKNSLLANFIGEIVTGGTSGLKAKIVDVRTGLENDHPDAKTLYLKYVDGGGTTNQTDVGWTEGSTTELNRHFKAGETLTVTSPGYWKGRTFVVSSQTSDSLGNRYFGIAHRVSLSPGLIYAKGHFVRTGKIGCYVDKFSTSVIRQIGFHVTEAIIQSDDDSELLDPASGTYNENSPGADRYKLTVALKSFPLNSTVVPENFYRYAQYEYGKILYHRTRNDPLNKLGDQIAKRAFETNGNYVVEGMNVTVREHLDNGEGNGGLSTSGSNGNLVAEISPGRASVGGYSRLLENTKRIIFKKPIETVAAEGRTLTTAYGNYVEVDEMVGSWNVGLQNTGDNVVDLYDTHTNAATTVFGGASSTTVSPAGTKIGEAKVRFLSYDSGTIGAAACKYKLYLYDIKMTSGTAAFADVQSIHYDNGTTDAFADIVASTGTIVSPDTNKMFWRLPRKDIKTLKSEGSTNTNISYTYLRELDITANAATINLDVSALGSDTLPWYNAVTTTTNQNLILVATTNFSVGATNYYVGQVIDAQSLSPVAANDQSISFTFPDTPSTTASFKAYYIVQSSGNISAISKTAEKDHYVKINLDTHPVGTLGTYSLGVADAYKLVEVLAYTADDYTTGQKNVTSDFRLNYGQKDNYYGLSSISKKGSSTLDLSTYKYFTVKFNYFSRTNETFATVDSYKVPATENAALGAGEIYPQEIPLYNSQKYGIHDLRDCVDFRPYVANTATGNYISTTVTSVTSENPSSLETVSHAGLKFPSPTETFTTDIQSYLPQGYRCTLNASGDISIKASPINERVSIQSPDPGEMTLATLIAPPFPCLASKAAVSINRPDLSLKVTNLENPHFTMRDIGRLEKRITNIEYYASLSLLEKQAKDQLILDGSGLDRFKNGLLVDSFRGHAVAAAGHPDYKAAIDGSKTELRAYFNTSSVNFRGIGVASTTQAGQTGPVFHVPYVSTVYTEQLQASKADPIVIELLYDVEDDSANSASATPVNSGDIGENINSNTASGEKTPSQSTTTDDITDSTDTDTTTTTNVDSGPLDIPAPVYSIIRAANAVEQGDDIGFYVQAENLVEGTTVSWSISGVTATEVSGGLTSSTASFASSGSFLVSLTALETGAESDDTVTLTLGATDSFGNSTGSPSASIRINGVSTSDPDVCGPGYSWNPDTKKCEKNTTQSDCLKGAGNLTLVPAEDHWYDVNPIEQVVNDTTGEWSQFNYTGAWETTWEGWYSVDKTLTPGDPLTGKGAIPGTLRTVHERGDTWVSEIAAYSVDTYSEGYWAYDREDWANYSQTVTNVLDKGYNTSKQIYTGAIPEAITQNGYVDNTKLIPGVRAYAKPINIDFEADALCPNTLYDLNIAGISKGSYTSDALGVIKGSFQIGEAEVEIGPSEVQLVATGNTDKWGNIESYATAMFTSVYDGMATKYSSYKILPPTKRTINGSETTIPSTEVGDKVYDMSNIWYNDLNHIQVTTKSGLQEVDGLTYSNLFSHTNYTAGTVTDTSHNSTTTNTVQQSGGGSNQATVTRTNTNSTDRYNIDYNTNKQTQVANPNTNFTTGSQTAPTQNLINTDIEYDFDLSDVNEAIQAALAETGLLSQSSIYGGLCMYMDPMAQTFMVENMPGGMFVDSVDLFFKSISTEAHNNGITVQIRDVVNGYPGTEVIATCHKKRKDCKITTVGQDQLDGTKFIFNAPVYLENNREYCIVPIPDMNDPDYQVWIGELGKPEIGNTKTISKQAHSGVLFTSANNRTWTAHQAEDMTFRVNRCVFRTDTTFLATLKNKNMDWIEFSEDNTYTAGDFVHGLTFDITNAGSNYDTSSTSIVVTVDDISYADGLRLTANTNSSGEVTGFTVTNYGIGLKKSPTITIADPNSGTDVATATVRLNRGRVYMYDTKYNTHEIEVIQGHFDDTHGNKVTNGTTVSTVATIHNRIVDAYVLKARTTNYGEQGGLRTKIALQPTSNTSSKNTTYTDTYLGETVELENEQTLYSYSNQITSSIARGETAAIQFEMKTGVNNLSPMVNAESVSMLMTKNVINNDSSGEEVPAGGSAYTRYISKKVVLADGLESEDFKIWLDNKIPSAADVKVYVKVQHKDDDSADFLEDICWHELEIETESSNTAGQQWQEYQYKVPTKGSDNFGLNGSGILEYDVNTITSVSIGAAGTNYAVGDVIQVSGVGRGALLTVASVGGSGEITGVTVTDGGRYTGTPTLTATNSVSGTGAGATLTANVSTTTFAGFKVWSVKIVHLSTSTTLIPKSSNLRAYALLAA